MDIYQVYQHIYNEDRNKWDKRQKNISKINGLKHTKPEKRKDLIKQKLQQKSKQDKYRDQEKVIVI